MPRYRDPALKASETVTFRLTGDERQLLSHIAKLEDLTQTGLVRNMLGRRATELGVTEPPDPVPRRKPGRPRRDKVHPSSVSGDGEDVTSREITTSRETAFGDLLRLFRKSFASRADGTRRELDETIEFLERGLDGSPVISMEMPATWLTPDRLYKAREDIKRADIRLSKKNLHLTYLRMMLHWALKQPEVVVRINPAINLEPFTLKEIEDAWPGPAE